MRPVFLGRTTHYRVSWYIYFFTVYHCFTSLNLLAKILNSRCSCIASYKLNFTTYDYYWHALCIVILLSGLVLQVGFLEGYVLESKKFSFWPFQFSVSVFHFSFPFPLFPNAHTVWLIQYSYAVDYYFMKYAPQFLALILPRNVQYIGIWVLYIGIMKVSPKIQHPKTSFAFTLWHLGSIGQA